MPQPLSVSTISTVKATVPALEAHGLDITRRMYQRMFQNENIREMFNQSHHGETGSQRLCCMDRRRSGWSRMMRGVLPFNLG